MAGLLEARMTLLLNLFHFLCEVVCVVVVVVLLDHLQRIKIVVEEREASAENKIFLTGNKNEHCQEEHNSIEIIVQTLMKQVATNAVSSTGSMRFFFSKLRSLCTGRERAQAVGLTLGYMPAERVDGETAGKVCLEILPGELENWATKSKERKCIVKSLEKM